MNINKYMKLRHRLKYHNNSNNSNRVKYLKNLTTRILLSVIFLISIGIYLKLDSTNTSLVYKSFFTNSLEFTKINNWYQDKFGKVIPDIKSNTNLVFGNDELIHNEYEGYFDGVKIFVNKNSPVSILNGGIVVFIGEKTNYGNTLILQGNDGIDYWYGNITNINVNLYDYLEKNALVGETKDDCLYLVLQKDGKYLKYDEYVK